MVERPRQAARQQAGRPAVRIPPVLVRAFTRWPDREPRISRASWPSRTTPPPTPPTAGHHPHWGCGRNATAPPPTAPGSCPHHYGIHNPGRRQRQSPKTPTVAHSPEPRSRGSLHALRRHRMPRRGRPHRSAGMYGPTRLHRRAHLRRSRCARPRRNRTGRTSNLSNVPSADATTNTRRDNHRGPPRRRR